MLVITSKNLHTPMYLFISQLSISDILVITDIVPKMLYVLLNNGGTITFISCITQFYFLGASETVECFLLAVMSYDRYVAICNPLHYNVIMKNGFCVILTLICWVLGFSIVLIYMITTAKLSFCGPNVIDHIFCDIVPLLELSCSDAYIVHLEVYFLSIPIVFIPITIIVGSYINIVVSVLKIPSSIGRHKAFSTCSSHLTVVSIFFWTIFSIYVVPTNGQSSTISKILSLLYTVFTPFVNPIIYSLRNYDFIKAIQKSCYKNGFFRSNITSIILMGLPDLHNFKFLFSTLLIIAYYGVITGNLLIIALYLVSKSLQSPMYFFITQLSLCDIVVTTDIVPTLLNTILYGEITVSFIGCIFQFFFFATSEAMECLLLSVMSYDRYLAICNPLRYNAIMTKTFCGISVNIILWISVVIISSNLISIYNLHFCGQNIIDHFYCDFLPLVQLSCSDTTIIDIQGLILGFLVVAVPFIIIAMSYVYIVITILKIPSTTGRHKAFSTCSSHLTVVSIFYGTLFIVYMFPTKGQSLVLNKVLYLMYSVLTPFLNPLIYTLRNKEFKEAFHKLKFSF
ncbi:olfactory receptor 11A1-like [Anomaloglossus baeobatrachus]